MERCDSSKALLKMAGGGDASPSHSPGSAPELLLQLNITIATSWHLKNRIAFRPYYTLNSETCNI